MAILNPFGLVCASAQPIQRAHFQVSFTSPSGTFQGGDNLEILSFPAVKQAVEVRDFIPFNSQIPYAGNKLKHTADATFRFFDRSKYSFWESWFKKVYDHEKDEVGVITDYIGNCEVTIYKPNGKGCDDMSPFGKIKIENCWPSSIGPDQLEMNSDESWGYSVTLQCLDCVFESS